MKSSKKPYPQLLIIFLLFEILAYITFLFPLKLVLKIEDPWNYKNQTFCSAVTYTPLLKELRQRFFKLQLEHCTLTENPFRRLILFYCKSGILRATIPRSFQKCSDKFRTSVHESFLQSPLKDVFLWKLKNF